MKVSQRLYLASIPAVLGVLTVAGLAYWGQPTRGVPEVLLIVAAITAVGTLIMAWVNVRYVAERVERLAHNASDATAASAVSRDVRPHGADELDAIEGVVSRLSGAVRAAEVTRAEREQAFETRTHDYARLLADVAASAASRIDEVRLPLHILLDNHFGDLNENQEELLGAARAAAEAADAELSALRSIAELELGTQPRRNDRVLPSDIVRAIAPTLRAIAQKAGARLDIELDPLAPAVHGDQAQLQDALSTLLGDALAATGDGEAVTLSLSPASSDGAAAAGVKRSGATIALAGAGEPQPSVRRALAARVIEANGGRVTRDAGRMTIVIG